MILSISLCVVRQIDRAENNGSQETDVTRRKKVSRSSRSIAGAVLIGLGLFILVENLVAAVEALKHLLSANGLEGAGILLAIVFAVARIIQAYAADHEQFLGSLLQHLFASFWPLLLVRFGTLLSRRS
jgi:uncharacterized membrane protein